MKNLGIKITFGIVLSILIASIALLIVTVTARTTVTVDRIEGDERRFAIIEYVKNGELCYMDINDYDYKEGQKISVPNCILE